MSAAPLSPWHTGRLLVLLKAGTGPDSVAMLHNVTGVRISVSSDNDGSLGRAPLAPGEGMLFEGLGAALLHGDPDQAKALATRTDAEGLLIEPERYVRATAVAKRRTATSAQPSDAGSSLPLADTPLATWGLLATRVPASGYTGCGIRVAMLNTGLDLEHPDFSGRTIVTQSFVTGLAVGDANGHGTHCAGIALGALQPGEPPRYGIAGGADIYVAKVLDDDANGTDGNVLAGIDWAVRNNCSIVSVSLGTPVAVGDCYSQVFEEVARRSLAAGSLLLAPAGNASQRPDTIVPVEHPANCPSILAIGAIDQSLAVTPFSNGGLNPDGGQIDLVAPGIAILSSSPRPTLYQTGSGTSVAAPFVAGIAALLAEAHPAVRGAALRTLLLQTALPLFIPERDAGAGLVQAPQ